MEKLHRAIYEELFCERMKEFKGESLDKISSTVTFSSTINEESIEHQLKHSKSSANEAEDSESICFKQKIVSDTLGDRGDDYKTEVLVQESGSKTRSTKENKTHSRKRQSKKENKLSSCERADRNDQAFDTWRKEKTISMRRMLKEERSKRREALEAQQAEIEKKRASHEEYLRLKKLQKTEHKFKKMRRQAIKDEYLKMQEQMSERTAANEQAYKAWKQHKDNESRQRHRQPQRQQTQTDRSKWCNGSEFDSWLDQLDSVLHQKYLRERRYLVRSFYCQPTYYGTTVLSMQ